MRVIVGNRTYGYIGREGKPFEEVLLSGVVQGEEL